MITLETERLICKSNLCVKNGKLIEPQKPDVVDIINIKPKTAEEKGFNFYTKETQTTPVGHIGIIYTRGRFEVSYGIDDETLRSQGYMTEALKSICEWLFKNTDQEVIWALPNGQYKEASIRILEKCNFISSDVENGLVWYELRKENSDL